MADEKAVDDFVEVNKALIEDNAELGVMYTLDKVMDLAEELLEDDERQRIAEWFRMKYGWVEILPVAATK